MDGLVTAPGASLGEEFWAPVRGLYDTAWPGMSASMARAEALGAPWAPVTTPFAWFEGGEAVAHVGVIEHPVVMDGVRRSVAGFHAVCTRPSHRGRGLALRLLREAARWSETRYESAKLHTDYPGLYAKVGFRVAPLHRFHSERRGGGGPARLLDPSDPSDLARLRAALEARVPCSRRLCTAETGWLPLIDACLEKAEGRIFHAVPGAPWAAAWRVKEGLLAVYDVFGPTLPGRDELLASVDEPFERVRWWFSPDLFDADAVPEEVPAAEGVLQVRGWWEPSGPVGIPMTWVH